MTTPTNSTPRKPWYRRWWVVTLGLIVVVAVAGLAWIAVDAKDDLATARKACEKRITEMAIYESGVEFIDGTADEVAQATEYGGIDYEVTGEVDLITGLGAPVRHTYWCHVGANDGETGRPEVKLDRK